MVFNLKGSDISAKIRIFETRKFRIHCQGLHRHLMGIWTHRHDSGLVQNCLRPEAEVLVWAIYLRTQFWIEYALSLSLLSSLIIHTNLKIQEKKRGLIIPWSSSICGSSVSLSNSFPNAWHCFLNQEITISKCMSIFLVSYRLSDPDAWSYFSIKNRSRKTKFLRISLTVTKFNN